MRKSLLQYAVLIVYAVFAVSSASEGKTTQKDWEISDAQYSPVRRAAADGLKENSGSRGDCSALEMRAATQNAAEAFSGAFTLEFDFRADRLPLDTGYYETGPGFVKTLQVLSRDDKEIMSVSINQHNRLTLAWRCADGKARSLLSTWDIKDNYEAAGILRGKWYKVSVARSMPSNEISLWLDGVLVGGGKAAGTFDHIKTIRLGNLAADKFSRVFIGEVREAAVSRETPHNAESSEKALAKARARLNSEAEKANMKFLPPENPSWAKNHPRLLLTSPGIEALKDELKKGAGPGLMKRLLAECSSMTDPRSPDYLAELKFCGNVPEVTKPAMLCLASRLTGDKKYAEHAVKAAVAFAGKHGYHDNAHQLVQSVLMAKPMIGMALVYDWGYEYMTDDQRRRIRLFLFGTAKAVYDYHTGNVSDSSAKRDAMRGWAANWTALSISTLGNACLAILGETDGPVPMWLDHAKFRCAQYGLFAVDSDGCFHEMPSYMAYGAGPLLLFMDALRSAGGEDLVKATNFSKFPDFLSCLIFPSNRAMMPLQYSAEINSLHMDDSYVMALLRKRTGTPAAEWCWKKLYGENAWEKNPLFNMVWFQAEDKAAETPGLPLSKWFKGEGAAAFRTSWTDKDAVAGVFMAYPAKIMAHEQCDRGQFTLCGFQGNWIIDSGGRAAPEEAWRGAHNLITVDRQDPVFKPIVGENYHHDSFMTGFCHLDGAGTAVSADITPSYRYIYNWTGEPVSSAGRANSKDDFRTAVRSLLLINEKNAPAYLLVYDRIQKDDTPHFYTLNLHTAPENEVAIENGKIEFYKYPRIAGGVSCVFRPLNKDGSRRFYFSGNREAGYAEYLADIPNDGDYDLYGYGRPGDKNPGGMDSFFVEMAGRRMEWGIPFYRWGRINKEPLTLKKGPNTLTLLLREPESRAAKLALFPHSADTPPLFDKPGQPGLIMIDAGNPSKIVEDFTLGKDFVKESSDESFMTLCPLLPKGEIKKEVFPGTPLSHCRVTITTQGGKAEFLNLFYPHKKGMETPVISGGGGNVFWAEWSGCRDMICPGNDKGIEIEGFQSDAGLIFIRMRNDQIIACALIDGSYLKYRGRNLIKLHGGKGLAWWSDEGLSVSGKDVYNFEFNFPQGNGALTRVSAHGKLIEAVNDGGAWRAAKAFTGENILTW